MGTLFVIFGVLAILWMLYSCSREYQQSLQRDVEFVLQKSTQPLTTEEILYHVGMERARAAWHLGRKDFDGKKYEPKMPRLQKALNWLLIHNKIDHFYYGGDHIGYIHRTAPSTSWA